MLSSLYISEEAQWKSLQFRDPLAAGQFVVCYSDTAEYCRPDCEARPALSHKNLISFADTCQEARELGYQPCASCAPECATLISTNLVFDVVQAANSQIGFSCRLMNNSATTDSDHVCLVDYACRHIAAAAALTAMRPVEYNIRCGAEYTKDAEESPRRRRNGGVLGFKKLAAKTNLSPWHFHRVFKAETALTPKAYGELCSEILSTLNPRADCYATQVYPALLDIPRSSGCASPLEPIDPLDASTPQCSSTDFIYSTPDRDTANLIQQECSFDSFEDDSPLAMPVAQHSYFSPAPLTPLKQTGSAYSSMQDLSAFGFLQTPTRPRIAKAYPSRRDLSSSASQRVLNSYFAYNTGVDASDFDDGLESPTSSEYASSVFSSSASFAESPGSIYSPVLMDAMSQQFTSGATYGLKFGGDVSAQGAANGIDWTHF